jgi:hypothetical protein
MYLKLASNRLEIEKSTFYFWQEKEKKDLNETPHQIKPIDIKNDYFCRQKMDIILLSLSFIVFW